jgi:hypothetical protein
LVYLLLAIASLGRDHAARVLRKSRLVVIRGLIKGARCLVLLELHALVRRRFKQIFRNNSQLR